MAEEQNTSASLKKSVVTISMVFGIACLLICLPLGLKNRKYHTETEMTRDIETSLTMTYGDEVHQAILYFLENRNSFEANQNPDLLENIYVGEELDYWRDLMIKANEGKETYWITASAELTGVRVLEYTPERFRALGCGTIHTQEVTLSGESLSEPKSYVPNNRIAFVFRNVDGVWKVSAFTPVHDPEEVMNEYWYFAADYMVEELGDIENYFHKGCLTGY